MALHDHEWYCVCMCFQIGFTILSFHSKKKKRALKHFKYKKLEIKNVKIVYIDGFIHFMLCGCSDIKSG